MPEALAGSSTLALGGPFALYAIILVLGTTVLFGMAPAWHALHNSRPAGREGVGGTQRGQRLRSSMVFAETALAAVLLVVAGLLLRSILSIVNVDAGFDRDNLLTANLAIPRGSTVESRSFFDQVLSQAGALPGVSKVGAVNSIPIAGPGAATSFWPLDRPPVPTEDRQVADIRIIRGDYLEAINVPLLEGRSFDSRDNAEAAPTILISQQIANRYWPEGGAVGKDMHVRWDHDGAYRIVGIVGDVHHAGLTTPPRHAIYMPHDQVPQSRMAVVLRSHNDAAMLIPPLRSLVRDIAPSVPLADTVTMDQAVAASVAQERFVLKGVTAFALLSLLLAALGLYSVTNYATAQRKPEIALRMALGAKPGDIRQLVFRDAMRLVLLGLATGLGVALLAGRGLQSQLFEINARDPLTFGVVAGILLVTALLAVLTPALRAARATPSQTLRET